MYQWGLTEVTPVIRFDFLRFIEVERNDVLKQPQRYRTRERTYKYRYR